MLTPVSAIRAPAPAEEVPILVEGRIEVKHGYGDLVVPL